MLATLFFNFLGRYRYSKVPRLLLYSLVLVRPSTGRYLGAFLVIY